ncbi:MAG: ATP-binding protein [Defluviitaleaceae bacterium]|nr:ATP-binding protein [Defluviitaleaceae bacterium]
MKKISKRESKALLGSLAAGVVPRIGLRHIAVGRQQEITAFLNDIAAIEDGGASFRLVSGNYGSGKSFLLQMIRHNAMERNFVVADADLSIDRRLTGNKGQGLATYRELLQNLSTAKRPDGGALESILQKWINDLQRKTAQETGLGQTDLTDAVSARISETMAEIAEMAYGYAFSHTIEMYWRAVKTQNDELKQSALRWLRAEFATKTDAKKAIGADSIIDDNHWYEFLKLFAMFTVKAGYKGLLLFLDEGVNLYKITPAQSRLKNYEKLLTIFNDTMQGKAEHIGFFLSGTPQFIFDEKRGLFNYEALRSRLADSRYIKDGFIDYTSPVIRLNQLSNEELFLLLENLCTVHSTHHGYETTLKAQDLQAFLQTILGRLGADKLLTPREITRDFLALLNILMQDPTANFREIISGSDFKVASAKFDPEQEDIHEDFEI